MGAFEREYEARLGDGDAEEEQRQRSETTTTTTTTTRPASDDARGDDAEVHTGGVILRLNAKLKAANAERDAMKRAHDAMARDLEARRVDPSAARAAGRHLTTNRAHSLTRPHPSLSPSSPVHHRATQAAGNEIERLTRELSTAKRAPPPSPSPLERRAREADASAAAAKAAAADARAALARAQISTRAMKDDLDAATRDRAAAERVAAAAKDELAVAAKDLARLRLALAARGNVEAKGAFYYHTGPHTTASAWCTPTLKEFPRRISPPRVPRFQSRHTSTPFDSASDAFQLRPDVLARTDRPESRRGDGRRREEARRGGAPRDREGRRNSGERRARGAERGEREPRRDREGHRARGGDVGAREKRLFRRQG
jgi:hypothetical protein